MKNKTEKNEQLLNGARAATSEQVHSNDFMAEVQKELAEIEAKKLARVSARPTKKNE